MNYDTVIVRYGEIFLKSDYVRAAFENKLVENVGLKLKQKGIICRFLKKRFRVYVESNDPGNLERIAEEVKDVFGIVSVSPALKTSSEMGEMTDAALKLSKNLITSNDSFAVRVNRAGKHDFKSRDVEFEVGGIIQKETGAKVDLTNPDKTIFIDIQDNEAFIFDRKIKGVGGMPYGTQGRVTALISGGIDSPVAAFMMARRGCEIIAVHFGNPIPEIIEKLEDYTVHKIKTYDIPQENFNEILSAVSKPAGKYTCVVCKRMMLKFAGEIAKIEHAKGIVMGDSLGQVASQTLDNLMVVSPSVSCPIYRPLIGMDKAETTDVARKIGTYKLQTTESCAFTPKKPSTSADLEKIGEIEAKIGIDGLIDEYFKPK